MLEGSPSACSGPLRRAESSCSMMPRVLAKGSLPDGGGANGGRSSTFRSKVRAQRACSSAGGKLMTIIAAREYRDGKAVGPAVLHAEPGQMHAKAGRNKFSWVGLLEPTADEITHCAKADRKNVV